jgi:hypothetical protein
MPVVRLFQVFLVFLAGWFIYWAHVYEITVWHKPFTETLSLSSIDVDLYIVSIIALVGIEVAIRLFKNRSKIALDYLRLSSDLRRRDFTRLLILIARALQVFSLFAFVWFFFWAHIYDVVVWNKTFVQTLSDERINIAVYVLCVLALIDLELVIRQHRPRR